MIDDSTEGVDSSSVDSSLTTISSSEGAETSSPWGGEGAWAAGRGTAPWALDAARGAVTDAFPEGDGSLKAPSLELVSLSEDATASPSWEGGDARVPVIGGFWVSGSGIRWESSGEFEGDSVASLKLSEGLVFFPETAQ